MLTTEWKEKDSCNIASLGNISALDFKLFLKYIYTRSTEILVHHGFAIWDLCDYFDVLPSIRQRYDGFGSVSKL
jgi:hypothetical protein